MSKRAIGSGSGSGRRILAVESLERRAMLAGNVTASVVGGNLIIRGDDAGNGVLVQQEAGTGNYSVTGFDFAGSTTKINGTADGTAHLHGVTGNIDIDLKKGNDALGVGNDAQALATAAEECGFGLGLTFTSGSGPKIIFKFN